MPYQPIQESMQYWMWKQYEKLYNLGTKFTAGSTEEQTKICNANIMQTVMQNYTKGWTKNQKKKFLDKAWDILMLLYIYIKKKTSL